MRPLIEKIPHYKSICNACYAFLARIDEEAAAKRDIEAIVSGRRPARDPKHFEAMSWEMKAHVATLQGIEELGDKLRQEFAELQALIVGQPDICLDLAPNDHASRFRYTAQSVPLEGREQELANLDTFLDQETDMSWWVVLGSGGTGKSRLALELCQRKGESWRAGFLDLSTTDCDWHNWQPEQPTLMVLDYAAKHQDKLPSILKTLARRTDLLWPVRVLLLERDSGEWLGKVAYENAAQKTLFDDPIVLRGLDPAMLVRVCAHMAGKEPEDFNQDKLVEFLDHIDPFHRPLVAMLLGDKLSREDGSAIDYDLTSLVRDVIHREMERVWKDSLGAREEEIDLVVLACIVGRQPNNAYDNTKFQDVLLQPDFADRYQAMTGQTATDEIPPWEPDLLGELCVLERLVGQGAPRVAAFHKLAWALAPWGMATFLLRAFVDYPNHPTLPSLWDRPSWEGEPPLGEGQPLEVWSGIHMDLMKFAPANPALAKTCLTRLADTAQELDSPLLRLRQADAAYNLLTALATSEPDTAQKAYQDIKTLEESHSTPEFRQKLADAAYNLLTALAASEPNSAKDAYQDIKDLVERPDATSELRLQLAQAATNLIGHLAASEPNTAKNAYQDIKGLAKSHSTPELWLELAQAAFNLLTDLATGEPNTAKNAYQDIKGLEKSHSTPELRLQLAQAAKNLIAKLAANEVDAAKNAYQDIKDLEKSHSTPELRLQLVQAATNLIGHLPPNELNMAKDTYRDIKKLVKAHEGEPALLEPLLNARNNLLVRQAKILGIPLNPAALLEPLARAAEHSNDPLLRELQAKVLVELANQPFQDDDLPAVENHVASLTSLAEAHPLEPELQGLLARGEFLRFVLLHNSGQRDEAKAGLETLVARLQKHPNEPDARLAADMLAKAMEQLQQADS